MPIIPVPKPSIARNGLRAFVLPCKRITLTFCNWGGSSEGMRKFLKYRLKKVAQQYPKIEFNIVKQPGHPQLIGDFVEGPSKPQIVKNLNIDEIENKVKALTQVSGNMLRSPKNKVESLNESVRGVWSPFHVDPSVRHKI